MLGRLLLDAVSKKKRERMRKASVPTLIMLSVAWVISCTDSVGSGEPTSLVIAPGGEQRIVRIGTRDQLQARALTSNGRDLGGQTVSWSSSDTAIAKVSASGMLRIAHSYTACGWVTPGDCRVEITASSSALRARQIITVIPFEPTLELNVSQLELESGSSARINAAVLLERQSVPWCVVSYASQNANVARADASGVVTGLDPGTTVIDVRVTGPLCPNDAAHVAVTVRSQAVSLSIVPADVRLSVGSTVQLEAFVRNRKDVVYRAVLVQWSSSNAEIATVEDGLVRAVACEKEEPCTAIITARSGNLVTSILIVVQ
jgi:uncharacterized protein YjdB